MVTGRVTFRLNIDDVPVSVFNAVIAAIDAQIAEWETEYESLAFNRGEVSFTEHRVTE